jgi:hypothetical protein
MPITPLDAITFANQNMQVAASKQNDYRNRIEQQKYAAVQELAKKELSVTDVGDLSEDQKVDGEREHNRQEAEEQTGEKATEIKAVKKEKPKVEVKEESVALPRILDIKV